MTAPLASGAAETAAALPRASVARTERLVPANRRASPRARLLLARLGEVLRWAWLPIGLLGIGIAVRAGEARGALLYPDGYQYLLMARGIAQHLRPEIVLGRGGELFVPNTDAALKPLFPALIAAAHLLGATWTEAARALSICAGAASVALCGAVAGRLSGSKTFGLLAALLVLADPLARYWAAFSSPDELGQALMLATVLALLSGRERLAGVLAGLTFFARPELGLLLGAAGLVSATSRAQRAQALHFVSAACATGAFLLALLRPPIVLAPLPTTLAALGALAAAGVALIAAPPVAVATGLGALALATAHSPALRQLVFHDLPLSAPCVLGLLLARRERPAALLAMALGGLAAIYAWRNGTSTRYVAELLPLAGCAAALGAAATARRLRPLVVTSGACVIALGFATAAAPAPGGDMFGVIAGRLPAHGGPLVTAAPDAYGFLLYPRTVRALEPGARGLLLDDAVARAYEPAVVFQGRVVMRIQAGNGFLDPSGRIDLQPALVIAGRAAVGGRTSAGPAAGSPHR